MDFVWCILIGYAFGCISPAALLAKMQRKNLRAEGTGNLGTTNAMMVLGKASGIIVLFVDLAKGAGSYLLAKKLFSHRGEVAGLLAGAFAVVGHVFPFYMRFRGGKGLAAFCGVAFAYNPLMFLFLVLASAAVMFIVNYSFVVPYSLAVLFCAVVTMLERNLWVFLITLLISTLILWKHADNVKKAKKATDIKVRDYVRKYILHSGTKEEPQTVGAELVYTLEENADGADRDNKTNDK